MPIDSQQAPTEEQYQNLETEWQGRQKLKSGKAQDKKQREIDICRENPHLPL